MIDQQINQEDFLSLFPDTRFRYIHDVDKTTVQGSDVLDLSWNTKGYGTFFTVNGFPATGKADKTQLLSLNGNYVDFDVDAKLSQVEKDRRIQETLMHGLEAGIPTPTVINRTQKGAHLIWIYPEKLEPTLENIVKWRDVQSRLVHCFNGDKQCIDPSRVLRVPYTMHLKDPQNPFEITVMSYKPESCYTLNEMNEAVPQYSKEEIGGKKLPIDTVLAGLPVGEGLRHMGIAQVAGYYLRGARTPEEIEMARTALYAWDREKNKSPERWEERKHELDNTFEGILAREMAESAKDQDNSSDTEEKQSQTTRLIELVVGHPDAELFHDEYGTACARILVKGYKENISCSSKKFRLWLTENYFNQYDTAPQPTSVRTALATIEGHAIFKGREQKLHNRIAREENVIWYDLADDQNRAVRITPEGWSITIAPPTLFRRETHQLGQVEPVLDGDARELFNFINVTNPDQQLLILVYLISCLIPGFPHPLLYLHGQQGSAKSSLSKILRMLIDPSRTAVLSLPKDIKELALQLTRHHLVFYENVSWISQAASDLLCIAVTGGSISKRMLFTDADDFFVTIHTNVGINGINIAATQPDLLERTILLGLERIGDRERKSEHELYVEFEKERPRILGALFTATVNALAIQPSIVLTSLPRMADFAQWGSAIAEALGFTKEEFLRVYNTKICEQSDEALEANTEAILLLRYMNSIDETEWQGEPSQLFTVLKKVVVDDVNFLYSEAFPKTANQLMRKLNVLKPNLRVAGLELDSDKVNGRRQVIVRKIGVQTVQSVPTDPLADGGGWVSSPAISLKPSSQDNRDDMDATKSGNIPF